MDATLEIPGAADLRLPDGTKLLHIGPPKTGTTGLQAAFHLAREAALQQGVHYAGFERHSSTEIRAVVGLRSPWDEDGKPPPIRYWNRLAGEVRASTARHVVLSGEDFASADEATIDRVLRDLGGPPIHVVVTLRPIARLLPSQWQQYVQNLLTKTFEEWLEQTLSGDRLGRSKDFWRRHRHDELVARWAAAVGPENVTAIVLDDREHDSLYRTFEALVGLRPGTLVPDASLTNRSMTLPEIEAIRAFNVLYRRNKLPKPLYTRVMRRGAAPLMERRRPQLDEPRVALPAWSKAPVEAVARNVVDGIAASGIRVVGDLERLTAVVTAAEDRSPDVAIDPAIVATMAMGVLVATGAARGTAVAADLDGDAPPSAELDRPYGESPELFRLSTPHLALVVLRRVRAAAAHRLARLARGVRQNRSSSRGARS